MKLLTIVAALSMALLVVSCSSDIPTSVADEDAAIETLDKRGNGADVLKAVSDETVFVVVDEKTDLMLFVYGSDEFAEPLFETFGIECDFPSAEVTTNFHLVTNPSNDSGPWRYRGPAAVVLYHYDQPLVFPPPEPIRCSDHQLVAYGVADLYKETGNDFLFGGNRTVTFGLNSRGTLENAIGSGTVDFRANARAMYRYPDLKQGIFNSLARSTNIRLSPDPRG